MGLFGKKKSKQKESGGGLEDSVAGIDPLEALPETEAAAKADIKNRRQAPSAEQRAYFDQINREAASKSRTSIGMMLENSGLVSGEMIDKVLGDEQATTLSEVRDKVVQHGLMREDDFMDVLAEGFGMETIDLAKIEVTDELVAMIPKKIAHDYRVFPVAYDPDTETVKVAVADPLNIQVKDDLERILRKNIVTLVARDEEIDRFFKRYYEGDEITKIYTEVTDNMHADEEARSTEDFLSLDMDDDVNVPPVVRFVDLIFQQAVHDRASDIHVEPSRHGVGIRFRIDGVCHEIPSPPKKWQNAIISRLKVLSGMDLAEKRVPQDGRIKLNLPDGRKLDLRVSALPAIYGESVVMRILDQSSVLLGLEDVGFLPDNIETFKTLIQTPTGVILMTGPTGSGKTTTLYSALSQLNNPETKIVTIENPVEYMIDGINQIQVNEEVGLDFKTGLRSILRQSPDVILVGEIRDMETAEIAVRAALTGHLVFSTLHTNDAPSATTRLIDMGVKPFLVASSIQAVIAQRLVRRLCPHCKRPEHRDIKDIEGINPSEEDLREGVEIFEPVGCDRCAGSGYRGRTAIHEIFVLDSKLRQMVIRAEPSMRQKNYAQRHNAMRTLRMDGWQKVLLGQTSVEELDRVTAAD